MNIPQQQQQTLPTSATLASSSENKTPKEQVEEIVRAVFGAWSAYQLALRQQTGGPETAAKDIWFGESLAEFLLRERSLVPWDLAVWLEEILSTEFDLIVDDGTLEPTASLLLRLVSFALDANCCGGDRQKARAQLDENLNRLRAFAANQQGNSQQFLCATVNDEDGDSEGSEEGQEE